MRTLTYAVRRTLTAIPVLLGVATILFLVFASLPVHDQLVAYNGAPSPHQPCGFAPTCECAQMDPGSVHDGHCQCLDPVVNTTPTGACVNSVYEAQVHQLGLDEPIVVQWATYVYHGFTFQWGYVSNYSAVGETFSVFQGVPVATVLAWVLPYTLELAALSLLLIVPVAVRVGSAPGTARNRQFNPFTRALSYSGLGVPVYLLGPFVICALTLLLLPHLGMAVRTPWCRGGEALNDEFTYSWPHGCYYSGITFGQVWPSWMATGIQTHPTGFPTVDAALQGDYWLALDSVLRMVLPALVIAFVTVPVLLRFVENGRREELGRDLNPAAGTRGIPDSLVTRRVAGRSSLSATLAGLGLTFAAFLGAFPVAESVFNLLGVGQVLAIAIDPQPQLDFGLILGCTLLFAMMVVVANVVIDVIRSYLDPRIRVE